MLAEKRLDVNRYQKFNNNAGFVLGQEKEVSSRMCLLGNLMAGQGVIEEEDEDEDVEEEEEQQLVNDVVPPLKRQQLQADITPEDVPQAFSHFSHKSSKGKMLVSREALLFGFCFSSAKRQWFLTGAPTCCCPRCAISRVFSTAPAILLSSS